MAFIRCLVVCTFGDTIASFSPISAFSNVLLPAFGLPKILTNPTFIEDGVGHRLVLATDGHRLTQMAAQRWPDLAYFAEFMKAKSFSP